jgi:hypothetical protein
MSLFAFLLTIQVLHGKSESKDDFVKKGAVRTAIATSFTVAYLMLLALGLDSGLGLNLNNGILANFHLVYIFTIGTYFVTASLERIVDLRANRHSSANPFREKKRKALSRRRNKILDPFFLEGSRQVARFSPTILL